MRPLCNKSAANLARQEAFLSKEEYLFEKDKHLNKDACEILEYLRSERFLLDHHNDSEVAAFYRGRSIFITGASGFVGKCLLEKLLRSCPDIKRVYILMRPKRGLEVDERVKALIGSVLFNRLRKSENGQLQLDKITPIRGDITQPLFGIARPDVERMAEEVSLIFHSAATVRFVEPLQVAVNNNVVSVDNLVHFAAQMVRLEALVHVSTAYSNCDRKNVDETFYEAPIDANKLIDMARWMAPETLDKISPALMGARPNTYTYTKAVAESLLVEKSRRLLPHVPIAMIRPSIVAGIWRQPIRGWVDNFNGPTGVILSMMSGAIQAMLACPNYCADIVPVDIVANLIICSAYQVHEQHKDTLNTQKQELKRPKSEQKLCKTSDDGADNEAKIEDGEMPNERNENISVFNCVSGTLNPLLWSHVASRMKSVAVKYPCNKLMRQPGFLLISNELLFSVFNFLNHTTFAYASDFFLKLVGQKPMFVVIYKRLMLMIKTLKPFTTNQWLFKCTNVTNLYESLSPIDKEIFNFDVRQVHWSDYLDRYYVGSK